MLDYVSDQVVIHPWAIDPQGENGEDSPANPPAQETSAAALIPDGNAFPCH